MHKSSDSFFSKILEKLSIVQKKMIPHMKGLSFSLKWSKKKFKMADSKNSKWPPQKKTHFPAPSILNIFSWNFHEEILRIGGAEKWVFFWGGHFEFFKSAILNFFLLHISEKPSPFIWGIIFFCTMDGFSRILEKKGGGLLCTPLYMAIFRDFFPLS